LLHLSTPAIPSAASLRESGGELRAALERVPPLTRLSFGELGDDFKALGFGEPSDGGALASMPSPLRPCSRVETLR